MTNGRPREKRMGRGAVPCVLQVELGEALAVLGHKRDLLVGHLLALTVRWSCDGGGDALGAEIREDSGGGGACGRGGEATW